MKIGDVLGLGVLLALFLYQWWAGARLHRTVSPSSRAAVRVPRLVARCVGSMRKDNVISLSGLGLHLLAYEWMTLVILMQFTAVPRDTMSAAVLILNGSMLLAGGVYYFLRR